MKAFILICLMTATGCVGVEALRQGQPVQGSEKDGKPAPSSRLSFNGVASPDTAVALTALDNERIMIEGQVANEQLLIEHGYHYGAVTGGPAAAYMNHGKNGTATAFTRPPPDINAVPQGTDKDAEQDGRLGDLENDIDLTVGVTKKVISIACPDDPKKRPPECDEKPKQ